MHPPTISAIASSNKSLSRKFVRFIKHLANKDFLRILNFAFEFLLLLRIATRNADGDRKSSRFVPFTLPHFFSRKDAVGRLRGRKNARTRANRGFAIREKADAHGSGEVRTRRFRTGKRCARDPLAMHHPGTGERKRGRVEAGARPVRTGRSDAELALEQVVDRLRVGFAA